MRARSVTFLGVLLAVTSCCRQLAAQEPASRDQLTLDASLLAATLSSARRTGSDKLVGVGIGVGYEFNIRMVYGEPWGRKSAEVAHIEMFERLETPGRWQYDLGVKVAVDVHTAQVASEATVGGFLGGYIAPMWGGRHFRIGPRLQAGTYWTSARPSLRLSITPLTARLFLTF
ncbi:MAG: hypothetical protein ABJE10_21710 [bacterium]